MIRNVVTGRLREDVTPAERDAVARALDGITKLSLPGRLSATHGPDLGLRDGGWDFAIVSDWVDADAYRNYDLDPEHNEHRAVVAAACAQISRVQFDARP